MPELSRFLGIVIALYTTITRRRTSRATFAIDDLRRLEGALPARVHGLVVEWATLHLEELRQDWQRARERQPLIPIAPLE